MGKKRKGALQWQFAPIDVEGGRKGRVKEKQVNRSNKKPEAALVTRCLRAGGRGQDRGMRENAGL